MIDVHAHFAQEGYDFPEEWEKIKAAGVERVILASDTLAHAIWHKEFCQGKEGCFFTVGIHPLELSGFQEETINRMRELALDKKCVAVGEIGLDYHCENPDKIAQREAFRTQVELADSLNLPIQIHSRDALNDTLQILQEMRNRLNKGFLMHCYSYGAENLSAFLDLGGDLSFGGTICFQNARRNAESARLCPLDRILTETDSPYLSPHRGQKNTPANIPLIVEKLAELKQIMIEQLEIAVEKNADRLFWGNE